MSFSSCVSSCWEELWKQVSRFELSCFFVLLVHSYPPFLNYQFTFSHTTSLPVLKCSTPVVHNCWRPKLLSFCPNSSRSMEKHEHTTLNTSQVRSYSHPHAPWREPSARCMDVTDTLSFVQPRLGTATTLSFETHVLDQPHLMGQKKNKPLSFSKATRQRPGNEEKLVCSLCKIANQQVLLVCGLIPNPNIAGSESPQVHMNCGKWLLFVNQLLQEWQYHPYWTQKRNVTIPLTPMDKKRPLAAT